MDKKVLKLNLHPETHRDFKAWVFYRGTTMQSELESHVKDLLKDGPKPSPVSRKQVVVTSQSKAAGVVSVEDYAVRGEQGGALGRVATGKGGSTPPPTTTESQLEEPELCAVCKNSYLRSEMTYHAKTMKWACNDCVENQKNNQG